MKIFVQTSSSLFLSLVLLTGNVFASTDVINSTSQEVEQTTEQVASNPLEDVENNTNVSATSSNLENSDAIQKSDSDVQEVKPVLDHDLSVWGMYQGADVVVKAVMIGLILASIITWTIALAKGLEVFCARRKLHKELNELKQAKTLKEASQKTNHKGELSHLLVFEAITELTLSISNLIKDGVKERVSFRLSRLIGNCGRNMARGTGILATIGAVAPFVGLFGTVWGIMNSFIGIAKSQTTNLAVVAPGIAEALLATALGLVAAIPAVIIYNVFVRLIASYKAQINDCASEVLLLLSRDLDRDINMVISEISSEINHQH